jgi:hypothetical protein
VSNAIQGEPWKRMKQLTRAFERISGTRLERRNVKTVDVGRGQLKKRTSGSLRSAERVAAMRLDYLAEILAFATLGPLSQARHGSKLTDQTKATISSLKS